MGNIEAIEKAAVFLRGADAVLITAGAGMGVDSGLPDFRGDDGFWKAYPPLQQAGIRFVEMANPVHFEQDPRLAWGFYGHRLQLYRATVPHEGFSILLAIAAELKNGYFVYTSNVDGQFQKAGFDPQRVAECHGSIHHQQCSAGCTEEIWSADDFIPEVDLGACRLTSDLPACPHCGAVARPNILMFNDSEWIARRSDLQYERMRRWAGASGKIVVIELGAGVHIPSIRRFGEASKFPLVRVNPRDCEVHGPNAVAVKAGALAGLRLLRDAL